MTHECWLSVDKIASHRGANPDTTDKWIEQERLPAPKVGCPWKFKATKVDDRVRAGKVVEGVENK